MSVSLGQRRRWSFPSAVIAAVGLLAVPGVAVAADATPIAAKYAALGGASGPLGAALGAEDCSLTGGGCDQDFANGAIVW